jgi:pyruvate dehydrogenase E1 component alpha subunit
VISKKQLAAEDMDKIDKEVLQLIDEAIEAAKVAADPLPEDLTTDVYVSY